MGKSVRNPWVYRLNLDARPVLPGTQPENRQNAQFIVEIFPFFGLFDFGTEPEGARDCWIWTVNFRHSKARTTRLVSTFGR